MVMSMSVGHIEYAALNGTHVFKLIGEVRAQACCSLDHLLERLQRCTDVRGAVVDLNEATFTDSTALGIVAKLGLSLRKFHNIQPILLSTHDDITTLAHSMGLGQIFVLLEHQNREASTLCTLPDQPQDQMDMLHTVLEAHRTLMHLSDSNRAMFEPLVSQLEREEQRQQLAQCFQPAAPH